MSDKHTLFFLHGIGQHETGWHRPALDVLKATRLALGRPDDFGSRYRVIGLRYDNLFSDYWDQFNSRAEALAAISLPANAPGILREVVDVASSGVDDDDPLIANWGDTVLYLTTNFGAAARDKLWAKITRTLANHGTPRFSIIAHSLGTRVIHDVLQEKYSGDNGQTRSLFGKPRVLAQVSNVVRSTSFNEDKLRDPNLVVHPSYDEDDGACWRYLNLWHPLDPVSVFRRFNPARYPALAARIGNELADIACEPRDVRDVEEIHDLEHHLAIPDLVAPIINGMENLTARDPGPIDQGAIDQARTAYEATTIAGEWEDKVRQIEELELSSPDSWRRIWEIIRT